MFEKISRAAERAASGVGVSRRGFLGRLGQGALATAGVLGGLLALSSKAQAGNDAHTLYSCEYQIKGFNNKKCALSDCPNFINSCGSCPPMRCCVVISQTAIGTC
jgi:hypothetical protein